MIIDGDCILNLQIDGDAEISTEIDGEVGTFIQTPLPVSSQEKTVTPTKTTQLVEPDEEVDYLTKVTVEPIPSQYITTTDANAIAEDIKNGKSAYVNGQKITGNYVWSWLGEKPEFISKVYDSEIALANTSYPSWTPSTTAKAVKAAVNAATHNADMSQYEYLIKWSVVFDAVYNDGTVPKVAPHKECAEIYQVIFKRPNSLTTLSSESYVGNAYVNLYTAPLNVYYNSSGSLTYTFSVSYGFYPSATAPTFSNATSDEPTITIKTPALNARCSTTYFSTAMAANIDQNNSKFKVVGKLYRMPIGSIGRDIFESLIDLYNE